MTVKYESDVQKYLDIQSQYTVEFTKWENRVTKILKRYRDDTRSSSGNETAKFNILWSNVQTLKPAVYARMPKADVSRRFIDNDPIARVAALLLERALDYEIEHYSDFRSCMDHSVEDRFLGGRGVGWVRYEPHFETLPDEEGSEITDDASSVAAEDDAGDGDEPDEKISWECSPTDYVHWKDFGHNAARTWEEVNQVWRWVYMSETAFNKRFPKFKGKVPFDSGPDQLNKYTQKSDQKDKAKVCELWDMETGKACWFAKNYPKMLDEVDDPLELEGFFPCGKPLYATTTSDTLVPVPDFVLYQDQANELDILSDRIDGLIKALRVRGIYDSSVPELQRLMTEGDNNTLVPTDKWAVFSEKGGLKGTIDLLPLDMIAGALLQCYNAQTNVKGQIYEITGISDIIRGESVASETATAQQIKGQWAGLRLKSMQDGVALFASELLRLKAQIICGKYQAQTIKDYAAASQLTPADQALIPQALELLKNDPLCTFRIEVESNSLVMLDEAQDKADRIEFTKAMAQLLPQAVAAGAQVPEMVPFILGGIQYFVGGFKQARTLEGTLDQALEQLKEKAAKNAANPQPTKEQMESQAEMQKAQAQGQIDAQIAQMKGQSAEQVATITAQANLALEKMRTDHQSQLRAAEISAEQNFERWKEEFDNATKIKIARISAGTDGASPEDVESSNAAAQEILNALGDHMHAVQEHLSNSLQTQAALHQDAMSKMGDTIKALAAPKRVIRGPDGRVSGIEPIMQPSTQTVQ